jgi:hypothetical protein
VNPRERLHTPGDAGYHENQVEAEEVDEVYQDDEAPCSFNIDPNSALESLLGDANDVTLPEERVQSLVRKRNIRYLTFLIFDITFFVFYITFLIFHINFFLFHMTFLIFHIMLLLHAHLCLFSIGCQKS